MVFSAYGALPVDGSVWSSFADVEGVTSVGHQLRVPSYGSLQDKMVSRLDWVQTSEQTYQPNILLSSTNLFIGGWWREDFAWWRVRWWRDRSLVASSLVASLPGGEVTGIPISESPWGFEPHTFVHTLQIRSTNNVNFLSLLHHTTRAFSFRNIPWISIYLQLFSQRKTTYSSRNNIIYPD